MFKIENSSRLVPRETICLDYSYNNTVSNGGGETSRKIIKSMKTETRSWVINIELWYAQVIGLNDNRLEKDREYACISQYLLVSGVLLGIFYFL